MDTARTARDSVPVPLLFKGRENSGCITLGRDGARARFHGGEPHRFHLAGHAHQTAFGGVAGSSQTNGRVVTATGATGRISIAQELAATFCAGRHSLPPALLK